MSEARGSQDRTRIRDSTKKIVRIEIVPAEEENRQDYLLTKFEGNGDREYVEGLSSPAGGLGPRRVSQFDAERAVEPLLKSLETAYQLVICMRRQRSAAGFARPDSFRTEVRKCVLKATDLRDGLADYLAEIRDRDDPTAA